MPVPKRPLKVFLCHAHADRDPVRGLYARLTKDGVDAWLDKEKLLPGQDWESAIRKAVREADVVIVCLSKQFSQKGFRQKEVRTALDEVNLIPNRDSIFIIPVRLEECDVSEKLRRWHWVDLFEIDGYQRLVSALQVRAQEIGAEFQMRKGWLPQTTSLHVSSKAAARKSTEDEDVKQKRKTRIEIVMALVGAVATLVAGVLSSPLIEKWFSPEPRITATKTAGTEITVVVSPTAISTPDYTFMTFVAKETQTYIDFVAEQTRVVSFTSTPDCSGNKIQSVDEVYKNYMVTLKICANNQITEIGNLAYGVSKIGPNNMFFIYITLYGDVYAARVGDSIKLTYIDKIKFITPIGTIDTINTDNLSKLEISFLGDHPYKLYVKDTVLYQNQTIPIPRSITSPSQ
jgi:hypothetical protein